MSVELPVEAQFIAYNARDLDAFAACYAEDFTAQGLARHPHNQSKKERPDAGRSAPRFLVYPPRGH